MRTIFFAYHTSFGLPSSNLTFPPISSSRNNLWIVESEIFCTCSQLSRKHRSILKIKIFSHHALHTYTSSVLNIAALNLFYSYSSQVSSKCFTRSLIQFIFLSTWCLQSLSAVLPCPHTISSSDASSSASS